jgi:hypothetical protein
VSFGFSMTSRDASVWRRTSSLFSGCLDCSVWGRFPNSLCPADRRARRWTLALRALDAVQAGASHREIATVWLGEDTVRQDWRGGSDYVRARVRRMVEIGEKLANGGICGF